MGAKRRGWSGTPLPPGWSTIIVPRILKRDGYRCYICRGPATEVDHVVPWTQGGTDEDDNLRAICSRCHASKTGREGRAAQGFRKRELEPHPGVGPPHPPSHMNRRS